MNTCLECGKPLRIVSASKKTDGIISVELICTDKTCTYHPIYELNVADIRSCGDVVEMKE